ncbi:MULTISPECIES: hypothetical protein [unclassified Bradyrhizobium]|nr:MULTISPECIES: hypothetical protein [unclassified Bradyrhizobium]MBR1208750.1 hypothetical protein [Bradyrhizobium sp. AUGA SZCCT0124]MBR1316943.1 hypothetical protein [Bradyrhizobium sp. AUGA SZCCT0051]MBR1345261.1 hypothetical protein [Bradyrhizobium sp. AUGA SZCCT0105]
MTERSKSSSKALRRAKNAVRGAFNVPKSPYFESTNRWGKAKLSAADLIVGGASTLQHADAEQFLAWVNGFPRKAVQLYPEKPITNPNDLDFSAVTIRMPLVVRLNWLSNFLSKSAKQLAEFVTEKRAFEQAFLHSAYDEAQAVLDTCMAKRGLSIWFLENQIALLQRSKGLDAQKEYSRSINANNRGRLAGVVSFWVSQRNEENTVFSRFRARLQPKIGEWKVDQSLRDAYQVILGLQTFAELSDQRASSALGSLATASLVDAYTSCILALEAVFTKPDWRAQADLLKAVVIRLPQNDPRVRAIAALLSADFAPLPRASTASIDQIYRRQIAQPCNDNISTDAVALLDGVTCSLAASQPNQPHADRAAVIKEFHAVIEAAVSRGPGFESKLDQGSKLSANLRHFPLASATSGIVALQDPEYQLGSPSPAVMFYLCSEHLHPWHAQVLPRDLGVKMCVQQFEQSPFARAVSQAADGTLDVRPDQGAPIREIGARFLMPEFPARSLAFLDFDQATADDLTRRRLVPIKVAALLQLGMLEDAIGVTAWACSHDPDIASLLPLRDMVDQAKRERVSIGDKLSLAILFDVYLERFVDEDAFQFMQFAYEDYLSNCGVQRPSELLGKIAVADTAKAVYFLRNIAVPEVMDVSFWLFKRSRDTLTERVEVCQALVELDPFNEAKYRDEIKDISRQLGVQAGLEDVDRSRVYVNLSKLHRWAEVELRESFDRYQALLRAGVMPDDPGEFDKVLKDLAAGKGTLEKFTNYPVDEAGQLLLDIYNSVAAKYLHDPDIGLDAYLSMRIRHGSLAGNIRGPLEEQGLLAVRDQGTNQYRTLKVPDVIDSDEPEAWQTAKKSIEAFSREFDLVIDGLAKEKLQIKSDRKPNGLFVFDPKPIIIYYLRANIDKGSTFSEFLTRVIDALHPYMMVSLQNVRKHITEDFNDAVARTVDEFRRSLDEAAPPALNSALQELVNRALPDLHGSIERVASWFAPDPEGERRALRTMEQIVDIAIEATNNAHRGFVPDITFDIEDLGLQSTDTLIEFTDILFTILDNIYSHSGMQRHPVLSIRIASDGEMDGASLRVRIEVTNRIGVGVRTHASERRLERINALIQSGDYRALSKVEGGTGFLKLKRIVAMDSRQTLNFGYRPDADEFFVEIVMYMVFKEDPIINSGHQLSSRGTSAIAPH